MDRTRLAAAKDDLLGELTGSRVVAVGLHWQKGIVSPADGIGSVFAPVIARAGVLPRVAAVYAATRAAGGQVAHLAVCNDDAVVTNCAIYSHAKESSALRCGTDAVDVVPEVGPAEEDWTLEHHRASVYFDTDLEERTRRRGADVAVFTGVATNVAVESSVRDACDRGLFAVVLSDCCLAATPDRHASALKNFEVFAAAVMTSDEYLARLDALRPTRTP